MVTAYLSRILSTFLTDFALVIQNVLHSKDLFFFPGTFLTWIMHFYFICLLSTCLPNLALQSLFLFKFIDCSTTVGKYLVCFITPCVYPLTEINLQPSQLSLTGLFQWFIIHFPVHLYHQCPIKYAASIRLLMKIYEWMFIWMNASLQNTILNE